MRVGGDGRCGVASAVCRGTAGGYSSSENMAPAKEALELVVDGELQGNM